MFWVKHAFQHASWILNICSKYPQSRRSKKIHFKLLQSPFTLTHFFNDHKISELKVDAYACISFFLFLKLSSRAVIQSVVLFWPPLCPTRSLPARWRLIVHVTLTSKRGCHSYLLPQQMKVWGRQIGCNRETTQLAERHVHVASSLHVEREDRSIRANNIIAALLPLDCISTKASLVPRPDCLFRAHVKGGVRVYASCCGTLMHALGSRGEASASWTLYTRFRPRRVSFKSLSGLKKR